MRRCPPAWGACSTRSQPCSVSPARSLYEGQAAIELEQLAGEVAADPWRLALRRLDRTPRAVLRWRLSRAAIRLCIAASFHETIAASAAADARRRPRRKPCVLSGGTFQNVRLLALDPRAAASALGFRVLTHRLVPPNDGGICYGQAAVAAQEGGADDVPRDPRTRSRDASSRDRYGRGLRCAARGVHRTRARDARPATGCWSTSGSRSTRSTRARPRSTLALLEEIEW